MNEAEITMPSWTHDRGITGEPAPLCSSPLCTPPRAGRRGGGGARVASPAGSHLSGTKSSFSRDVSEATGVTEISSSCGDGYNLGDVSQLTYDDSDDGEDYDSVEDGAMLELSFHEFSHVGGGAGDCDDGAEGAGREGVAAIARGAEWRADEDAGTNDDATVATSATDATDATDAASVFVQFVPSITPAPADQPTAVRGGGDDDGGDGNLVFVPRASAREVGWAEGDPTTTMTSEAAAARSGRAGIGERDAWAVGSDTAGPRAGGDGAPPPPIIARRGSLQRPVGPPAASDRIQRRRL